MLYSVKRLRAFAISRYFQAKMISPSAAVFQYCGLGVRVMPSSVHEVMTYAPLEMIVLCLVP